MAKVAKTRKIDSVKTVESIPSVLPLEATFAKAYLEVVNGQIALSKEQYERIRLAMVRDQAKGQEVTATLERLTKEWAAKEYGNSAMELPLKWLWDKYIAGRIKDQFVANVIFQILVKGIDEAFEALKNWLKGKDADIADNLEDAITTAVDIAQSGKIGDFKDEVESKLNEIKQRNEADKNQGKKIGWFRWLLNAAKAIFS